MSHHRVRQEGVPLYRELGPRGIGRGEAPWWSDEVVSAPLGDLGHHLGAHATRALRLLDEQKPPRGADRGLDGRDVPWVDRAEVDDLRRRRRPLSLATQPEQPL